MTGFHDIRFPDAIARGATGGPEYSTDIIAVASGFEQRNVNWSAARARYDIGTGIRSREQMFEVIAFFRARKGRAYGFRFRDWTDFEASDQALEPTADPKLWQLVKRYPSGPIEDVRIITKPVAGSVTVRVNGAVMSVAVDHLTGRVTFSVAPVAIPYADFHFDVPCRFDTDHLPVIATAFHLQQVASIPVVEIRA
jgi:uncharacterized protein (TIGR02217 family)